MKRDMDLVRKILLEVEEAEHPIKGEFFLSELYPKSVVFYHVKLMQANGLLDVSVEAEYGPEEDNYVIDGLTWDGHDYLEAIRDERVWTKTKSVIKNTVGSTTMGVIKTTATEVALAMIRSVIG
jgi:hypothetical protein